MDGAAARKAEIVFMPKKPFVTATGSCEMDRVHYIIISETFNIIKDMPDHEKSRCLC